MNVTEGPVTTESPTEGDYRQPPLPARPPLTSFAPGATAVAVTVAMLLIAGVPLWDLLRYAVYLVWGLLLPGTLVYRALRVVRHSLLDDLAFGAAVGFALEIAAFSAFSAAGLRELLWCWPLLVVVPFVAIRPLRRHWRPTGGQSVPRSWAWAVAVITILLGAYVAAVYVSLEPITPQTDHYYFGDLHYLLALAAEAKHHFPLHAPQVANEPLAYHWFSAAHMASASLISGVELPAVFYGLAVPAICLVAVPLFAVIGWRVTGRPWVGVVAATLTFVVGELAVGNFFYLGDITRFIVWASPSQTYAFLSTCPLIFLISEAIRQRGSRRALGRGHWALIALFGLQSGGSKAAGIPVLLAGLGLAGLVELVRRRRIPAPILLSTAVLLVIYLIEAAVLFRFESHGLRIHPGGTVRQLLGTPELRPMWKDVVVALAAVGAFALFMLVRLVGTGFTARYGRPWQAIEWFLLGTTVAGVAAALIIDHPAWSQMFFLRSAWPAGAILSALGAALFVERYQLSPRWIALCVGASAVSVLAVGLLIEVIRPWQGGLRPWQVMEPIYGTAAAFLALIAIGAAAWPLLARVVAVPRGAGAVSALAVVLLAGLPILPHDIYASQRFGPVGSDASSGSRAGPTELALARWVRANVGVDEVLATNEHCLGGNGPGCIALRFWFSAYTERRVLVGAWGYVPRAVNDAAKTNTPFGLVPFWDQQLLADNDVVFGEPTADRVRKLRERYGVRWLFVNRSLGAESPALASFADLRFSVGQYAIYQLRTG